MKQSQRFIDRSEGQVQFLGKEVIEHRRHKLSLSVFLNGCILSILATAQQGATPASAVNSAVRRVVNYSVSSNSGLFLVKSLNYLSPVEAACNLVLSRKCKKVVNFTQQMGRQTLRNCRSAFASDSDFNRMSSRYFSPQRARHGISRHTLLRIGS